MTRTESGTTGRRVWTGASTSWDERRSAGAAGPASSIMTGRTAAPSGALCWSHCRLRSAASHRPGSSMGDDDALILTHLPPATMTTPPTPQHPPPPRSQPLLWLLGGLFGLSDVVSWVEDVMKEPFLTQSCSFDSGLRPPQLRPPSPRSPCLSCPAL